MRDRPSWEPEIKATSDSMQRDRTGETIKHLAGKIGNGTVPVHFWPKIAGGCLHETLKPYTLQIGQVEGCFGKYVPRGPRFVLCSFGFLIENNFLDALAPLDFKLSVSG